MPEDSAALTLDAPSAIADFNRLSGRLRISITHACQLRCRFCHREGIDDHWRPIHMPVGVFARLVEAFDTLGGTEINITGGDPLVHPDAASILEIAGSSHARVCLCTNGLNLPSVEEQLQEGCVDEIKLSVHAKDDEIGKRLLGKEWSSEAVHAGLGVARRAGTPVTVNFSLTTANQQEFRDVAELALAHDTNLLVIDLIGTRWNLSQRGLDAADTDALVEIIREHAEPAGMTHDRTGCRMAEFRTPSGRRWAIKDVRNGLLFTGMCAGCRVRHRCGEGVFVLRVDARGTLRPCLLRGDLAVPTNSATLSAEGWVEALSDEIAVMMQRPHDVVRGHGLFEDQREWLPAD